MALVPPGARLILLDERGKQTVAEINAAGGAARYVHLDVTSESDWTGAIETATSQFGKLDMAAKGRVNLS
mgnify:CR=1 FL=1